MGRKVETADQVIAELRALSAQFVHPKDTFFASMADVVQALRDSRDHHNMEAVQCAAMRDALLERLSWSNVNGRGGYLLRGVNDRGLGSLLVEAANAAKEKELAKLAQ